MSIGDALGRGFELATDAQFRELSNLATPPRAGRVTAIESSGQVRVECDDPDGGDVLAWPLNGFTYAVDDVVYIAFAVNAPDSALVIGSRGLPTIDPSLLPFVKVDGSTPLTAEWDIGEDMAILAERLEARDGEGLAIYDDGGNLGLFVKDGGNVGVGGTTAPTKPLQSGDAATDMHASGTKIALNSDSSGAEMSVATAHASQRSGLSLIRALGNFASPAAVTNGDSLGFVAWKGWDGAAAQAPALIEAFVDGAPSSGAVPSLIALITGSNGGTRARRLIIFNDGKIAVGNLTAVGAARMGVQTGSASNDAAVGGVLYVTVGAVGQVGGGPDTLGSYSVPANTLTVNNQSICWRAAGVVATSATSAAIAIKFGATTLLTINASPVSGGEWWAEGTIYRTGATAQRAVSHGQCNQGSTIVNAFGDVTPGETLSGAVTLTVTGNSTSAANNDTVLHTLKIGWDDPNT
jgi:hypothetical protein